MRTIRTKHCYSRIVVGLTEDEVEEVGRTVVIPGGRASDGCTLQFAIPAVNDISSRAISPV